MGHKNTPQKQHWAVANTPPYYPPPSLQGGMKHSRPLLHVFQAPKKWFQFLLNAQQNAMDIITRDIRIWISKGLLQRYGYLKVGIF